jgi:hypothetical protein
MLSNLLSAAALAVAVISIYKQRQAEARQKKAEKRQERLEQRIDKKEELRELADFLQNLSEWIQDFHDNLSKNGTQTDISYPYDHHSFRGGLNNLCKEMLGYQHYTGNLPTVEVSVFFWAEEAEEVPIESADEAIELYDDSESPTISLRLQDDASYADETVFHSLSDAFSGAGKLKFRKQRIEDEYGDLINEFSPDLLERLESQIDKILKNCIEQSIQQEPSLQYDVENHDSVGGLAEEIFEATLRYDGVEEDLEDLEETIEEIKSVRKSAMQTSYS